MDQFQGKRDVQVQGTNDRATLSKFSTVTQGYYEDKFLQYFVSKASRRAPIIHRSYYIRTKAIHYMVKGFLRSLRLKSSHKQIVSLGAGFDTLFFSLVSEGLLKDTKYFEVDFPEVVKQKASLILQHKELSQALGTITSRNEEWLGGGIDSEKYSLLGCNLKNRPALESSLQKCGLNTSLPTLLLSEVVLTYMDPPQSSTAIIGWAAQFFTSAMFVMFEQVSPCDPFGIKMINHFKHSVGAPLHATEAFPTRQSQIQRFMEEGWPLVHCPTLNFFYYDTLPKEEKVRLEDLEPFDEFEEWHLMCSHYMVLSAFKGSCQDIKDELFYQQNALHDESPLLEDSPCTVHTVDVLPSRDRLKRFGHTATPLSDDVVLLTGGFGLDNGKHMRLNGVQLLRTVQGVWHCTDVTSGSDNILGGRIFHTATRLNNNSILIYGGRTSPSKPCAETLLLSLQENNELESSNCTTGSDNCCPENEHKRSEDIQDSYEVKKSYKYSILNCQGDIPQPRWRHSATLFVFPDGSENILVFGGRTSTCLALGDCYLLDIKSRTWSKVFLSGDAAVSRHSHTACAWNNHVVLAGGLDASLHALDTVQIIDMQMNSMTLRTLQIEPPLPPRYSHTAHVIHDSLILVGGVTPNSCHPPGVVVLHLKSLTWKSYTLPTCTAPSMPLMLHNHRSVCWEDSQGIMVLGGGGNCFSFGTHLNDGPVFIDLPLL
ncbi:hypothetical protein ACROYT_G026824 [Oculina patagonica]